jgi:Tfp pilus assembly PilM family ATPase
MRVKRIGSLPAVSNAPPPIAIDFGARCLKVLQVSGGEHPKVVAATQIETPEEIVSNPAARLRFQMEALPKLIRKGKFTARRAVCVLPASNMFCKHMRLQLADGVDAESMIAATLPMQIGCAYETLVCRHHEVVGAGSGGKTEIICMAAGRELVGRLMAAMKAAKLEPVGVHSPFHAMHRAFEPIARRERDMHESTLYLDLGYAGTNVLIADGPTLSFARTVELGGLHLDTAIAAQRHVGLDEASQIRWKIPASQPASAEQASEREGGGLAMLQAAIARDTGGATRAQAEPEDAAVATEEDRRAGGQAPGMSAAIAPAARGPQFPEGVNLAEPLEILVDEIAMCVRYHKAMFPNRRVEKAVLLGGEARQVWLCQALARGLRLSMHVGDPLSRLDRADAAVRGLDLSKAQPGWAAVLGACLSPTDL